ncbi:MAG: lipoyl(octanoyl) transferase LipB [Prevotellaceae bacterium]|jgi:lipoyl(octanoyl) transferase|nr:lipoyl(octanoyl) transferase LipB [Prevotellaceae bacterium]
MSYNNFQFSKPDIQLIDLAIMNYKEAWQQQSVLMEKLKKEKAEGKNGLNYLLFVEHPHVYTLGRNGNQANMLINTVQLAAENVEFIKVDRGGDITYHGPGQLVVYPIFCLNDFKLGVKEYVRRLEEVVIRTIAEYGLKGERMEKATGVWLDIGTTEARKICAIGVRCSQSVTMHGFALNVNTDLTCFKYINPCGFVDKGVTSMAKETGKTINIDEIKNLVIQYFNDVFGVKITNYL